MSLSVVLAVLKWILIIAGVLCGLIVVAAALILFVPVRYSLSAKIPEEELTGEGIARLQEGLKAEASFHWLLHIVRGRVSWPDAPELDVRPKWLMRLFSGSAAPEEERPDNLYEVFSKIQYTISSVCDKIGEVRTLLESDTFARAKEVALREAGRLLGGIRPRRSRVRLRYGTYDPYLTGEILAVCGMLYPLIGSFCTVEADFEKTVIGGDALIRGRVRLFTVLRCLLVLYFNKDIRRVRARWQHIRRREDEPKPV